MSSRTPITIDRTHCNAICEEIGDRLRIALSRESPPLPKNLKLLLDQFRELDCEDAPSIIPSTNELVDA